MDQAQKDLDDECEQWHSLALQQTGRIDQLEKALREVCDAMKRPLGDGADGSRVFEAVERAYGDHTGAMVGTQLQPNYGTG